MPILRKLALFFSLMACGGTIKAFPQLVLSSEIYFSGSCDASGAVPLNNKLFAVADDEDNIIRIYNAETGGAPLFQFDLSYQAALKTERDQWGRPQPAPLDEMDIEAATSLNGLAYWITSHGRDKKGRVAPARLRFFATEIDLANERVSLAAPAETELLSALVQAPQLAPFNLASAAQKAAKAEGGLNLEGMTATPEGTLLLGFRNPIPEGKALFVTLNNPEAVLKGTKPVFGPPQLLALDGRGIRGISYWNDQYLIAAGHYGSELEAALYLWQGGASTPRKLPLRLPAGFNIEAFFTPDQRSDFMVLSDDGGREIGAKEFKKLKDVNAKSFRGIWIRPQIKNRPI